MKPIKVCIIGAGQFSQCFVPLYKTHPLVSEVSLCEVLPERLAASAARLGLARTFACYEDVLKSDVDAVAIFTQRWAHAPMSLQALEAGKHVYSAVPAATTLEELHQLIEAVKRTGLTYMMGETSLYYGARLFCQEKWDAGAFGRFVYGEGEYYHDMTHGFYEAYQYSGGENWKSTASYPPMLYPTHSVAMILGTTGARAVSVSCFGQVDQENDGVFREDVSLWKNSFSNQSALFRTSDGGMMRINEFRRVGTSPHARSVRLSLFGTRGSFEEQAGLATGQSGQSVWVEREAGTVPVDVEPLVTCKSAYNEKQWEELKVAAGLKGDFLGAFGRVHQKYRSRLPESYKDQPNGHEGSHQFLTDDFVTAVVHGTIPRCSIWDAARFNAPGIVAHESAQREGERLAIPDFGTA